MSDDEQVTGDGGPRSREARKANALRRLEQDGDVWVGTADRAGVPCLVPLFFWWDGEVIWLSTRPTNPTGANLAATGLVRLAVGTTRDVVQIEGRARAYTVAELPAGVGEAFAAKGGWDPRTEPERYDFYRVTLDTLRAWGTVPELKGRLLLRDGAWLL